MANDRYIYLRDMSLHLIDALIDGSASRSLVDGWFVYGYLPFASQSEEYLTMHDSALFELIDCLGLVTSPNESDGYLYQIADFKSWKESYQTNQNN